MSGQESFHFSNSSFGNKGTNSKVVSWSILCVVLSVLVIEIFVLLILTGAIPNNMDTCIIKTQSGISISSDIYGTMTNGTEIERYKIQNSKGSRLEVITLGGIMTELWVPDKTGKLDDVLLTYKNLAITEEKMVDTSTYPYFGALVGRVANRISGATFTLDGQTYDLPVNNGDNSLHGGTTGWSLKVWKASIVGDHLRLDLTSPDGDNGFPGTVDVTVTYSLSEDDALAINWTARVYGKDTPINPTSHGYFNLAGEGSGTINEQKVTIFSDTYLPTDPALIPYGNFSAVEGTGYDLRTETKWGDAIPKVVNSEGVPGLDVCYSLKGPSGMRYGARIEDPVSGRVMKVYTDQLGLQVYTSNYLDVPAGEGKRDHAYPRHAGFCMETHNYPDAINQPTFPDSVLRQGSEYRQTVIYKFSTL